MIDNSTVKIDNANCFVAYLELQNFNDWMGKWKQSEIKKQYLNLFNKEQFINNIAASFIGDDSKIVEVTETIQNKLFLYSVSNGIVLAINDFNSAHLHLLLYVCLYIKSYLSDKCNISIIGGVSSGCFFGDGMIAFGKGFIDAYEFMKQYKNDKKCINIAVKKDLLTKSADLYVSSSNDDTSEHEKKETYLSIKWNYKLYKEYIKKDYCYILQDNQVIY